MVGLAVGLITGRRELVAAIVGAVDRRSRVALAPSPAIGIVAGGLLGPLVGLLVPARPRTGAPLGPRRPPRRRGRSRSSIPGRWSGDPRRGRPSRRPAGTTAGGAPPMSTNLVLAGRPDVRGHLPVAGAPLLTPGIDRLPTVAFDYLQLVGPAVLAALAAVNVMVVVGDDGVAAVPRRDRVGGRLRLRRRSSPGGGTCSSAWSRRSPRGVARAAGLASLPA